MNKPVVICVDDEPTVLESLKIELKQVLGNDCLIETAEGGDEALELFKELQSEDFEVAVVLADYIMPGLRGDELMQQIYTMSPQTLNIMISGQADLEAVANSIRYARLYRYIAKPWNPRDLKATVLEAIQSYLQDRKLESQTAKLHELYEQVLDLNSSLEKQVQERTAELQWAVAELKRLGTLKDEFLNTVSHELRSPVSNVRMAVEMLEASLQDMDLLGGLPDTFPRYLQILREECDRQFSLVNDLLDLARLDANSEPLTLQPLDIKIWLPYVTNVFSERAVTQQQQFRVDVPDELPTLLTDVVELERILQELLHNACKYTPSGEQILVSVQFDEVLQSGELQPLFLITIRNSGVEIPSNERDRIFEQFYRIAELDTRGQGGTGLGLALVKRRVERLRGTVSVTSEAGWTTFTIRLPQQSQPQQSKS